MKNLLITVTALAFNAPVVAQEVRAMSTDRPDQTEGAYTVPKGMYQFEFGLLSYARRLDTDNRSETFTWGEVNAKYGLTHDIDLQLIWQPYIQQRNRGNPADPGFYREGVADITARVKWNLVGNDGGPFALALLPFVKIPTATHAVGNDMWEGGLAVNTQIDLGGGFTLGNSFFGNVSADSDDTLYFRPAVTASLGYGITEKLGCYAEVTASSQMDEERYWQTSFDAGLTYAVTDNLIFDAGVNWFFRGDEAINPFCGFSIRF